MSFKLKIALLGIVVLMVSPAVVSGTGSGTGNTTNPERNSAAATEPSTDRATSLTQRDQMILRIVQLAQAGRVTDARQDLRAYLGKNPHDATMYYNLTCLDLFLKDTDAALLDLEQALENGYSNFRLIESDRDLILLHETPQFTEMVTRFENDFRQVFQASTLFLDEGIRTEGVFLEPHDSGANPSPAPKPEVSLEFNSDELSITVDVSDASYNDTAPPWKGGCGVLVNLVLPLSLDEYESKRYFSFGFFAENGVPEAALVAKHGEVLLQPVPELKPAITRSHITR